MTPELRRGDLRRDSLMVLRHLERWGGKASYARLVDHLVDGRHGLYPEDLDGAISQLIFAGFARVEDGVVELTSRGRAC